MNYSIKNVTSSYYSSISGNNSKNNNDWSMNVQTSDLNESKNTKGSIYSVYDKTKNGDVGITNNLLINGSTTYSDQSVCISNTPPLLYPDSLGNNSLIFNEVKTSELSHNYYLMDISMSSSGQYQTLVEWAPDNQQGLIYTSSNYGKNWHTPNQTPQPKSNWTSVAVSGSGKYQTAVSYNNNGENYGFIYISSDYGENWSESILQIQTYYKSVSMSTSGQYQSIAMSYYTTDLEKNGTLYSKDYGVTWKQSNINKECFMIALSSSGQYQTTTTSEGVWCSKDYGVNWKESNVDIINGFVDVSSSGQYQTITTYEFIYISNDYGENWSESNAVDKDWRHISMSSSGQYQFTTSYEDKIWYSTDYGENWIENNSPTSSGLWTGISMSSTGQFISGVSEDTLYTCIIPFPSGVVI